MYKAWDNVQKIVDIIFKSMGPKTLPCGTPEGTGSSSEFGPSTLTNQTRVVDKYTGAQVTLVCRVERDQ